MGTMKFTAAIFTLAFATASAFSPVAQPAFRSNSVALNAEVTVALIKELRGLTGAGMMDCKKALIESEGDVEVAIENMRTSGQLKAAKKATKVASEGQIIIRSSDSGAALLEVNCQTDFVAKDESSSLLQTKSLM